MVGQPIRVPKLMGGDWHQQCRKVLVVNRLENLGPLDVHSLNNTAASAIDVAIERYPVARAAATWLPRCLLPVTAGYVQVPYKRLGGANEGRLVSCEFLPPARHKIY